MGKIRENGIDFILHKLMRLLKIRNQLHGEIRQRKELRIFKFGWIRVPRADRLINNKIDMVLQFARNVLIKSFMPFSEYFPDKQ